MIDKRELMEKARSLNLSLGAVEKDYVLGWVLYGISKCLDDLVFKGGSDLSKIYFKTWRLSEDLDFNLSPKNFDVNKIREKFNIMFELIEKKSGIKLNIKSEHTNPGYIQFKLQYKSSLEHKNFVRIDINKDINLEKPLKKSLKNVYSDYPKFKIKVKSLSNIIQPSKDVGFYP